MTLLGGKTVLVVGGGAAGMMAAGTAAGRGERVLLIEKNRVWGKKLRITGKGRCNVTNLCDREEFIRNVPTGGKFLFGAISRFGARDTVDFFESLGVPLKTERGNRVFPVSDKAADIADALARFVTGAGVETVAGQAGGLLLDGGSVRGIRMKNGGEIAGDAVVIATGGLSYPLTGSTGDGYLLAKAAGHRVAEPKPSLVPLVSEDRFCAELQGLSLKNVAVRVIDRTGGREIFRDFGEMVFAHFGLSGPVVLSASAHMRDFENRRYEFEIDLKPALSPDVLDARLIRDFSASLNRDFVNSLDALLPRRLIPVITELSGIDPRKKVNSVTRAERQRLLGLLKGLTVNIAGPRPIEEAIITSGGVMVDEINPATMESKLAAGLYFAGEVLDVDAYTGGFNLQIAFSTGRLAGNSC